MSLVLFYDLVDVRLASEEIDTVLVQVERFRCLWSVFDSIAHAPHARTSLLLKMEKATTLALILVEDAMMLMSDVKS